MSQKRQKEDGAHSPRDKRRRLPTLRHVISEVMRKQRVQNFLEQILEPLVRRVVKEEIEAALGNHFTAMSRSCEKEVHPSESRSLQLQFLNGLSLPLFTGARLEGDDGSKMKVALVDGFTGRIVDTGPESSANVEIVVLEGDFDGDEGSKWTVEEFENNIVRERDGKRPLLTGDGVVKLKDGVGLVGEIVFSDNSSWTRSRRFRLGARVMDKFEETRIREAKTESFVVKDHRGELYKKHHPPAPLDDVWRLEKIGKDGAFHKRLSEANVNTVKDFLILLSVDPSRLRTILGAGMSRKMWEVTVEHARTCSLDQKIYLYRPPSSEPKAGVLFNMGGQGMGRLSDDKYIPSEKLSEAEKADDNDMVISARQHWEDVVAFGDESCPTGLLNTNSALCSPSSPGTSSSGSLRLLTRNQIGGSDYAQRHMSSPNTFSSIFTMDDYSFDSLDDVDLRFNQSSTISGLIVDPLIHDPGPLSQSFADEEHFQFFDTQSRSRSPLLSDAHDKAQRRWRKLFSIFKWFSIRKLVLKRKSCAASGIQDIL
ncbi:calmodulin-binding protein 60 A-like isoform X1 [Syzygium oleosum]|uniref:calmodulin-binding protein 60 A-like isoform X1 n=2 Tax=Syzygium oleosum TaxID=219896 RepID=UPI0024BBAAA4|nr:calmodulin-binding protein 60 A-like isoform X1 [Syzygium oleosum]